jgi:predicted MarR family transcription regulator
VSQYRTRAQLLDEVRRLNAELAELAAELEIMTGALDDAIDDLERHQAGKAVR